MAVTGVGKGVTGDIGELAFSLPIFMDAFLIKALEALRRNGGRLVLESILFRSVVLIAKPNGCISVLPNFC